METTLKARHMAEGTVIVTRAGHRREIIAIDETRTHVYADFADGGSGIWELDQDVTVERPEAAPAPISSQAGLASIRAGKAAVSTAHAHTAAYQGTCQGECGV